MNLFFIIITTLAMPSHPTPTNRPKVVQRFFGAFFYRGAGVAAEFLDRLRLRKA